MPIIPAKIDKSFIIQVKKVKMETKNRVCIKSEKCQIQNIRKWVVTKQKLNP